MATPPRREGALFTEAGIEGTGALELRELLGVEAARHPRVLTFPVTAWAQVARLAYRSQSALHVGALLGMGSGAATLDGLLAAARTILEDTALEPWFPGVAVHVRAERAGEHPYSSLDAEREVGAILLETVARRQGRAPPVNLHSDLVVLAVLVDDAVCLLVDFAGGDLGKRPYKVFNIPTTLKGPLAYHLARQVPLEGATVLDPCCGSGTVLIEAGLHLARRSPRYYTKDFPFLRLDWGFDGKALLGALDLEPPASGTLLGADKDLRHVSATKKNLKIAGLDNVSASRLDLEWLDTKYDKGSVDAIVTQPPLPGRNFDKKKLDKFYAEFFYQADFILKPAGRIVLLVPDPAPLLAAASARGFAVSDQHTVWGGKQAWQVLALTRVITENLRF